MYLSKITIDNFRGIEHLEISFSPKINIIVGENGCCKSAVIDALRLLYSLGEPKKDLYIGDEDFFEKVTLVGNELQIAKSNVIKIAYEFKELSNEQKGAFYEYMVVDPVNENNDYARIELRYKRDKLYPIFSYITGNIEGQKADTNTFQLFQHYYLGALRDSTKDLMINRHNILGKVIKRLVDRNKTEDVIKGIVKEANDKLLDRPEVKDTRQSINDNLETIYKNVNQSQIGVRIEQSKVEYIVNAIKPYLPHDFRNQSAEGFDLWQNSLGFNNLIYIATVLGDLKERVADDSIPSFALLIEEPEAHIHPQLQLSLYNFLKDANSPINTQLFVTTHSPTLTSKVPFENLIVLDRRRSYTVSSSFKERESENLIQDSKSMKALTQDDINTKQQQLQRYVDVTKSQLFFARSCLFVEGISEELLIYAFARIQSFSLEDYRIELVNVDGVSFYPFLFLFNSADSAKRLPQKIAILTDDDRFSRSKHSDYSLDNLIEDNYNQLAILRGQLKAASPRTRLANLESLRNRQENILICSAYQTFEFQLCYTNVGRKKIECQSNFLFNFVRKQCPDEYKKVSTYIDGVANDLEEDQRFDIALLLWKCLPNKAVFAQNLALEIENNLSKARETMKVPSYILSAFNHLKIRQ